MKRLASFLFILLTVFVCSRAIVRSLPGDPVSTMLAETGTSIPPEALRKELHLDRPFFPAMVEDAQAALHGDLGRSLLSKEPVAPLLGERFLRSLWLTLFSVALGLAFSVTVGVLAASRDHGASSRAHRAAARFCDRLCTGFGALAAAMPATWLGPILIWVLAVLIPLFPLGDHVALPALSLAFSFAGLWCRLVRERVRESLHTGAARGARARGIAEWKVLLKYGLVPVSGPLLAYLGTQVGAFLSTGFVTEVIFDYPGMGSLLVDAVLSRDYPIVEAAIFVGSLLALGGTWLGDWAQTRVDPRLREASS
jgi:peptide/nickel transport system permease protein